MFDKIYRVLVIFLLASILGMQVYTEFKGPSPECQAAVENAVKVMETANLSGMLNDYENSAYNTAENINQQIFIANEYVFISQNMLGLIEQSLLEVQIACK